MDEPALFAAYITAAGVCMMPADLAATTGVCAADVDAFVGSWSDETRARCLDHSGGGAPKLTRAGIALALELLTGDAALKERVQRQLGIVEAGAYRREANEPRWRR